MDYPTHLYWKAYRKAPHIVGLLSGYNRHDYHTHVVAGAAAVQFDRASQQAIGQGTGACFARAPANKLSHKAWRIQPLPIPFTG